MFEYWESGSVARNSLRVFGAFFICLILLGITVSAETPIRSIDSQDFASPLGASPQGVFFDYVVIMIMENHSLCSIVGSIVIGCPNSTIAPYETELAQNYTVASNYTALAHPSPPNYVSLIGGSTFNMSSECFPGYPCGSNHLCCPINSTNIVDRLDKAGLTWKGYAEDYAGGCRAGGNELPFNYFWDIYTNSTRCARVVSAETLWSGNTTGNPDKFLNDLGSIATASNFMWLSPSPCDQWHHLCTGYGATSQGDFYLTTVVPRILKSTIFTTQRAALFIVYDEGNFHDTCPSGRGDCVYAVWAGPQVKRGYVCGTRFSHYSFLRTLELNWGLENLTSNDGSANPMSELFAIGPPCDLQVGFTDVPSNPVVGQMLSFSALASGGVQTYSYSWNFGDGGNGNGKTISHTYQKPGRYTATLSLTDAASKTVTASHVLTVAAESSSSPQPPPPTSLLLIGVPVGLTLAVVLMNFVRRRRRKTILGEHI